MAVVNLTISGRDYEIACDDSQAARVEELGREVDSRAQTLTRRLGVIPDARLLVMVGLMLADELTEARNHASSPEKISSLLDQTDMRIAENLESLAARLEGLADRLEKT